MKPRLVRGFFYGVRPARRTHSNLITVGNYSLWDGYVSFKPIPALKLLVGINNPLDTNPPFSNQQQNWQTRYNPIFSSPLGRTFYPSR